MQVMHRIDHQTGPNARIAGAPSERRILCAQVPAEETGGRFAPRRTRPMDCGSHRLLALFSRGIVMGGAP